MRKIITITALAAVAVMAFAAPSFAAKGNTKVVWDDEGAFETYDGSAFEGFVDAKTKCYTSRRITVYKVRPGADKKMGSTKTTPVPFPFRVSWGILKPGYKVKASERFYAKTPATSKCKGGRSPTINGVPDEL